MKEKTTKRILTTLGVLALVGGAVHLLQPLGYDILEKLVRPVAGDYTSWVQFVAGVATLVFVVLRLKK